MFNLYLDVDKSISNNLLIEPRDDYYSAGATKDWTNKWAVNMETLIKPMGALTTRQFLFQMTPDKDFWNNLYTNGDKVGTQTFAGWNGETYGQHQEEVVNDVLLPHVDF